MNDDKWNSSKKMGRRAGRRSKFNPTQDFINQAKLEYILRGGKITVLESFKENNAYGEALKHGG